MQATLTAGAAIGRRQTGITALRRSTVEALRLLQATIVNGSDHPCWRQVDGAASFGSLPVGEQGRLLDAGLAHRSR